MRTPAISVVIPTYNRASAVLRSVASVLAQTFKDHEVIVVDDGSTDGTEEGLVPHGGRIIYVRHGSNRGVSAARNTGINLSKAPLLAFLDSDDYWLPEKLEVQVNFFQGHPEAVACQTDEVWFRRGRRVNPMKKHEKPSEDIFLPSLRRCLVSPSAVMLKRELLEEVGTFDEALPACEDYDLWLRIGCRYPVYLIPTPLVVKEGGHPDQLSRRYTGMDRFRIQALIKLIRSGVLSDAQRLAAVKELSRKCRIYGNGCLKRGKVEEGRYYTRLPAALGLEITGSILP